MNNTRSNTKTKPIFLRIVLSILFFLILFSPLKVDAQTDSFYILYPEIMDSLEYYKSYDQPLNKYTFFYRKLRKKVQKTKKVEFYKAIPLYLNWMVDHPQADSVFLRKQFTFYAYILRVNISDINESLKYYKIAHEFGNDNKNITDFWFVENILGIIYNSKGDHDLAEYYYKKAIFGLTELISIDSIDVKQKEKYFSQRTRVKHNLGYLYFWEGKHEIAKLIFKDNIQENKKYSNDVGMAHDLTSLAETYLELEHADSMQYCLKTLKIYLPKLKPRVRKTLTNHAILLSGKLHLKSGKNLKAISNFKEISKKKDDQEPRFYAKVYMLTGQAYLNIDSLEIGRKMIKKGLTELNLKLSDIIQYPKYLFGENAIAELLEENAHYLEKKYLITHDKSYLDTAIISINRAIFVYELLREEYIMKDAKLSIIMENRRLVEICIDFHNLMQMDFGRNATTLNAVEVLFLKSKNLLLQEINHEQKIIQSLSETDKDIISNCQDNIQILTEKLVSKNPILSVDEINEQIIQNRTTIKKTIKNTDVGYSKRYSNGYFVEFLLGTDFLYRLENFSGKIVFRKLSSSKNVKHLIAVSQKGIIEKDNSQAFYDNQFELYELLFKDIENLPNKFTIIPDDLLLFVAFPALITNIQQRRYLIENHIVNIVFDKKNRNFNSKKKRLLTIAPKYPKHDVVNIMKRESLFDLLYTKDEIDAISKYWSHDLINMSNISKSDFFTELEYSQSIHYAGHAIVSNGKSYLALGIDSTNWVSHEEVQEASNNTDMVVLSACQTGVGNLYYGEGVNSMARSFLMSGTKSVLYSLWPVNDKTTSILMSDLYKSLGDGEHLASSLVAAQRFFLESHSGKIIHPYYWSAFVAVDANFSTSGTNKNNIVRLLSILILTLFGVVFFYNKIKTHES